MTLSLEVVNRYEHYLLNMAGEGVRMAEETESGFCKVLLDSFHMNIEEDDMWGKPYVMPTCMIK